MLAARGKKALSVLLRSTNPSRSFLRWWSLTSLIWWINEKWEISWPKKANLLHKHGVKNENKIKGGQMGTNVKKEVEGALVWLRRGRMCPLLLERFSAAITVARRWQQRAPKARITLADPYGDMEAETVHRQAGERCFENQKLPFFVKRNLVKSSLCINTYLKGKWLDEGTEQIRVTMSSKAKRKKRRNGCSSVLTAYLDLRFFWEDGFTFWIQSTG